MKLHFHRFTLRTRHVFTISRGSTHEYRALLVSLEHQGRRGFGEAGESDFYGVTLDGLQERLEAVRGRVEAWNGDEPAALWAELDPLLQRDRFAQCALDSAACDLWGKLRGQPLWRLWGLDVAACPPTDYTIGIDTVECMLAKMREFPDWPVYKIKLGTPNDLEIVRALRRQTSAVFRVDANCAWSVDETVRNAQAFCNEKLGVEFIEQPMPRENWEDMREAYRLSPLPLVADESCCTEDDVARCAGCFHGVNVKLVKCGGLTPARRMLLNARALGLKTMVGCMTESTVGISAAAQLLPLLDYADLDGALLLADDVATGVRFVKGRAQFSAENGCGIQVAWPD